MKDFALVLHIFTLLIADNLLLSILLCASLSLKKMQELKHEMVEK